MSNNQQFGIDLKPTKYKAGFEFYNNTTLLCKLIEWTKVDNRDGIDIYRWKTEMKGPSSTILCWTDDILIDKAITSKKNLTIEAGGSNINSSAEFLDIKSGVSGYNEPNITFNKL